MVLKTQYAAFSKAADLPTQADRVQKYGFTSEHGREAREKSNSHLNTPKNNSKIKIVSGARIVDENSNRALEHAEKYYGLVRKMKTDIRHISKNTGFSMSDLQEIKNYLFIDELEIEGTVKRFDPDFAIAQSWQRLINGDYEPHDITLLRHEKYELSLVRSGMTQDEAHILASEKYNYKSESEKYYGSLKKHNKGREKD